MSAAPQDISDVRKAWKEANLAPLWENAKAHRPPPPPDAGYLWSWDKIRPLITAAIKVASPEAVERRVLQLVPPIPKCQDEQQTSRTLAANIQILLPGEKARPHRHTMNALRFVLEGSGASTIVDGKSCPMEEGDLILTPAWTWHEHVHQGSGPIIWLDALDVPFQQYMGTGAFQPGPIAEMRRLSPTPPSRSPMSYPIPAMRPGTTRRCSGIPMRARRPRWPPRRPRATARGACATSTRSPAARGWR